MRRIIIAILIALLSLAAACSSKSSDEATTTTSAVTSTTSAVSGTDSSTSSTTTTAPSTTTTDAESSTTTTRAQSTATTTRATTTTTIPADNEPPTVQITAPANLSAHIATFDASRKDFGAVIAFSATASDPNGDPVEVRWSSSGTGYLGTGESISAWVSTQGSDASQPIITATAIDQWGVETSASIQIIVWIPSDA